MPKPLLNLIESEPAATPPNPRTRVRWLREPLVHFVLLGGLLFGLDQLLLDRKDDPRTIVVGPEVDSEAIETFKAVRGHEPNGAELNALRRVWLDNEVLYREGLALAVDKGDVAIRERVIFKALSVIDSNVKVPPPDDVTLRKWFDAHREKYDEPARYDFEEAVLAAGSSQAEVESFVEQLKSGVSGDAKAGLRVFAGRPEANLVQSYGEDLAKALPRAQVGQWQAFATRDGWRAMRLNKITPATPAVYENVRGVVMHDWTDATAAEQRTAAVRALAKKYKIKHEVPTGDGE